MVDVRELKENYPEFALVLDTEEEEPPNFSELAYKQVPVPVHDVAVGSFVLVGAGEVSTSIIQIDVIFSSHAFVCLPMVFIL